MLYLGIDTTVLSVIALACIAITYAVCSLLRVSREEGELAVMVSGLTALAMFVGYVIMTTVLDHMIGIYW